MVVTHSIISISYIFINLFAEVKPNLMNRELEYCNLNEITGKVIGIVPHSLPISYIDICFRSLKMFCQKILSQVHRALSKQKALDLLAEALLVGVSSNSLYFIHLEKMFYYPCINIRCSRPCKRNK